MLLAIDIGNTNIVLGVFGGQELLYHWRIATRQLETADEFGLNIENLLNSEAIVPLQIRKIVISSVVPPLENVFIKMCRQYFNLDPLIVNNELIGMPNLYKNPQEVGADRLVNAVAGYKQYGGPLIIVDFGTATTFCLVSAKGEYLGGCIAPGIHLSAKVLHDYTAKLPQVEIAKPEHVIGKTTVTSIQAGLFYGYVALVNGIVEQIQKEFGHKTKVVATGGLAQLLGQETKSIQHINPWLTLEGLCLIANRTD